jgi:hypothetical protein
MPAPAFFVLAGQAVFLDDWLRENYPYLYGNDTGETEYWKNLGSAKFFIDQRLISENNRLSEDQKIALLAESQKAYDNCSTWWPFDSRDEVTCFYNTIAVSFPPIVGDSDPNILQILGLSTEGVAQTTEADVSGSEEIGVPEGESKTKIPTWAWIAGAGLVYIAVMK